MTTTYETVIGLEIHAELKTQTKLFCSCPNDPFRAPGPNVYVCPLCLGLPGTLPVMNRQAVEWSALVGLAVGSTIGWPIPTTYNLQATSYTKWDRKNYFYPDLPKGYQISQYDLPIDHVGSLMVDGVDIAITRIHLEEDTGKLVHPAGTDYSLIDYNRAGVPLLELVTEPVIRSGAQAAAFAQLYQLVLRTLGVANADMEKGEMRVEANISVRPVGSTQFGTKVEVKNLNSFKSVERAIAYETDRQIELIEQGGAVVQETRGWDEGKQRTFTQRIKETAADYRYFPDPDLPPVTVAETTAQTGQGIDLEKLRAQLPELPWEKLQRYLSLGMSLDVASRLVADLVKSKIHDARSNEQNLDCDQQILLANWIVNGLIYHSDKDFDWHDLDYLLRVVLDGKLTVANAKTVLEIWQSTGQSPSAIIESEGLAVIRDESALGKIVAEIIEANPQAGADYRAGKAQAVGFLVGQVMAKSRGQADPSAVQAEIIKALE